MTVSPTARLDLAAMIWLDIAPQELPSPRVFYLLF